MLELDLKEKKNSPLKKKDLMSDFGKTSDLDCCLLGGTASQKDLECETDEEEEQEKKDKIKDSNSI